MVICNTVKGNFFKFMENKPIWHYRSPTIDEFKIAMKGLKKIKISMRDKFADVIFEIGKKIKELAL